MIFFIIFMIFILCFGIFLSINFENDKWQEIQADSYLIFCGVGFVVLVISQFVDY